MIRYHLEALASPRLSSLVIGFPFCPQKSFDDRELFWEGPSPTICGCSKHYGEIYLIDFGECMGMVEAPHRRGPRMGHSVWLDFGHVVEDTLGLGIVQRASHPRSSLELAFLRQLRRAVQPAGGAG